MNSLLPPFRALRSFITIAAFITATLLLAQNTIDVVELKNGSVIRGSIVGQVPAESLKLKTADGSVFVYRMDEVVRITRETVKNPLDEKPDMSQYGGTFGLGVAIGGGGVIGLPIRSYVAKNVVLEGGIFLRPSMVYERRTYSSYYNGYQMETRTSEDKHFAITPFLAGGIDVMLGEHYDKYDRRVVRNGIMFRTGTNLSSNMDETMIALGWVRERFNRERKNASYNMELGLGAIIYGNEEDNPLAQFDVHLPFQPMVYLKLNWNWYVAKKK